MRLTPRQNLRKWIWGWPLWRRHMNGSRQVEGTHVMYTECEKVWMIRFFLWTDEQSSHSNPVQWMDDFCVDPFTFYSFLSHARPFILNNHKIRAIVEQRPLDSNVEGDINCTELLCKYAIDLVSSYLVILVCDRYFKEYVEILSPCESYCHPTFHGCFITNTEVTTRQPEAASGPVGVG